MARTSSHATGRERTGTGREGNEKMPKIANFNFLKNKHVRYGFAKAKPRVSVGEGPQRQFPSHVR